MPEGEINIAPNETTPKPEFDGGTFTIDYLSPSPGGFEVETRQSLPRHAPNTPLPEAARIGVERSREPKKFRVGPGFKPKVGLRNLELDKNNKLIFDIMPVTMPTYKAINNLSETEKSLSVANPTGTASVLLTTEPDETHKIH